MREKITKIRHPETLSTYLLRVGVRRNHSLKGGGGGIFRVYPQIPPPLLLSLIYTYNTIFIGLTKQTEQLSKELDEKGNACLNQEQYKQAAEFYTNAILLNPKNAAYYSRRSHVNLKLEKFDEALKDASEGIICDENHFDAYYNRIDANIALDRYELALADYETLKSKESNAARLTYIGQKLARFRYNKQLVNFNIIVQAPHTGNIFMFS